MESLEALWSITIASNVRQGRMDKFAGGGVVVIDNGRILGGDAHHLYVGTVNCPQGTRRLEAEVMVRRHRAGGTAVFGPLDKFRLKLAGEAHPERFILEGHVVERQQFRIVMELKREENLP